MKSCFLEGRSDDCDRGFGLVEVVIAIFLLSVIAVMMLPSLYNGIMYSSEQASSATATRYLNQLVEKAREDAALGKCDGITNASSVHDPAVAGSAPAFKTFNDAKTSASPNGDGVADGPIACTPGTSSVVTLNLRATTASRRGTLVLASVDAKIYVP